MAFLLARLEQENQALAKNPRVIGLKRAESKKARPPSIQVLKKLVEEPNSTPQRFSLLPNPPPMTELDFWAALVKDYPQTAQRLPTLTANKIKGGVPPPLRGVVWTSMVGARDPELSDKFDKLSTESSPYETMIGKDIGRSFPGVEMFKEAGGEGQSMLAMVLKVFSLYDTDIGYCQGLGFLVGPLLMQMGEKEAFCVLVKLMEKYDLRSCFMPDLAGLHLRIFQFQRLLTQHMPTLSQHLAGMQVEAAYLSQWFLSFFAVTCPLPMLFRIYDVILAEGASETIMRVAMSLMKRNEEKLMKHTEFEEIMQLLLGRDLWEVYDFDPDDLVNDFVGLTGIVTHDVLSKLEKEFRQAKDGETAGPVVRNGLFPDVSSAASRFLGRLWVSHGASKSQANAGLAPVPPPSATKSSFLRRSPSKQSVSISINSSEDSAESGSSSTATSTTEATTASHDSSADVVSIKTESIIQTEAGSTAVAHGGAASKDRDLHGQIEDLLTAIAEMQRDQAVMTAQLQKEREEREEDHKVMQELVNRIKTEDSSIPSSNSPPQSRHRQTISVPHFNTLSPSTRAVSDELSKVVDRINERLAVHRDLRRSSVFETKARLRESLLRSKDQLSVETAHSQKLTRQLDEQERETGNLRQQLADARAQVQQGLKEKQRLEQIIADMRAYQRNSAASNWSEAEDSPSPIKRTDSLGSSKRFSVSSVTSLSSSPKTPASAGGLRELKLARRASSTAPQHATTPSASSAASLQTPTAVPARGSSLATKEILATKDHIPATEDQMLVDLVAAKTAEATARQELEEMKGRMESMRKMLSQPNTPAAIVIPDPISGLSSSGHKVAASESQAHAVAGAQMMETPAKKSGSLFSRSATHDSSNSSTATLTPPSSGPASATVAPTSSGWFPWARRTVSTTNATIPEEKSGK